jgi:hypothetical protein
MGNAPSATTSQALTTVGGEMHWIPSESRKRKNFHQNTSIPNKTKKP